MGRKALQENPIPSESIVRFQLGHDVDKGCDCAQSAHHDGIDPFAVLIFGLLSGQVEVDGVEAADGEGEDELEEAKNPVEDEEMQRGAP